MYTRDAAVDHPEPVTPIAGKPKLPVNQQPVACHVDEIGRYQHKGHRLHQTDALEVTPESGIEQERQRAPAQCPQERRHATAHGRIHAPHGQQRRKQPEDSHQQRRQDQGQVDALPERALAVGSGLRRHKACATNVSRPRNRPSPNRASE